MKIIFYDIRSVAGETLAEINSFPHAVATIPNKGDGICIYLEDGNIYVGEVQERKFIIEKNNISLINVVCIGKRS